MQMKENLRTGSMMQFDDAVKTVNVENRDDDGTVWAMAIAQPGMKPHVGFTLNAGKHTARLLTWMKLDRGDLSSFRSECSSKRCTLVQLPPGVGPKDLVINGK